MRAAFGWTLLSRDALKKAEAHLREDTQGVRDEVGFLALHQAYADRFFPGTSVLHTRLRYALFVPWIYERLLARPSRDRADRLVEQEEIALAGRLKKSRSDGVIGGRTHPDPTSQPPTMVYWTALSSWGILRPDLGEPPSRAAIHRALARRPGLRQSDDDKQPLEEGLHPFGTLPRPPKAWDEASKALDFGLEKAEQLYLMQHLSAVMRPGQEKTQSLMARLAESGTPVKALEFPWESAVLAIADREDVEALKRVSKAAALSAVGRGVYAALVEELRQSDGLDTPQVHRTHLKKIVVEYKRAALEVDADELAQDSEYLLGDPILEILKETQSWLRKGGPYLALRTVYEEAEVRRKTTRARLPKTLAARRRRAEWIAEEHPEATPLHFRWPNVRRLLGDLRGDQ